jgi:hypothetical protein
LSQPWAFVLAIEIWPPFRWAIPTAWEIWSCR